MDGSAFHSAFLFSIFAAPMFAVFAILAIGSVAAPIPAAPMAVRADAARLHGDVPAQISVKAILRMNPQYDVRLPLSDRKDQKLLNGKMGRDIVAAADLPRLLSHVVLAVESCNGSLMPALPSFLSCA